MLGAITRNDGVFQPPLISADLRVLEGNRRVTALRKLHAADTQNPQWRAVTVHQLGVRIAPEQERALRAKFHLENALPWDALSQLTEYLAVAERDGPDLLATMIGKFRPQIEPLIVAGRAVRRFSELYPELRSRDLLLILVGLLWRTTHPSRSHLRANACACFTPTKTKSVRKSSRSRSRKS